MIPANDGRFFANPIPSHTYFFQYDFMNRTISSRLQQLGLILLFLTGGEGTRLFSAVLVDTSGSKFARMESLGLEQVRWTGGFWQDRLATCYESTIPSMWKIMESGEYKPFLGHFLIAAGKAEGGHHGAKWNDGDFYKWLEAAVIMATATDDEAMKQAIERSVAAIAAAQREDGYLHTPVLIAERNGEDNPKPFQDRNAFEMYNMGHLMTAACVHHRLTGKTDLLQVARKAADFLQEAFRDPTPEQARNAICPSHYMGTVELYRTTGEQHYLELAKSFLEMRNLVTEGGDDNQDRLPFVKQREIAGHAVRANYLYAGVADLVAETGTESWQAPLEPLWESMVRKKLYITGACGALYDGASPDGSSQQRTITRVHQAYGRNYQLPNTTAHNETCANIGNLLWCWRMFLLTGESKYIDVLEQALYNSILSGVSLSGDEYFYVNPLRVVDPLPTALRYPRTRQKFFTSFCCPTNLVRTIAEVNSYAYSKSKDCLWVNLYGENQLETQLLGEPLSLTQVTSYPWDGSITLKIKTCPAKKFAVKLRVPSWSGKFQVKLNQKVLATNQVSDGYVELRRTWQSGDTIELSLPMPVRRMEAHPLVEELSNQVAIQRGPLVYCLESHDLPAGIDLQQVLVPLDINLKPRYTTDLLGGVAVLEGTAKAGAKHSWGPQLYREAFPASLKDIRLRLVPYYAWANRGPGEMSVWLPVVR